MAVIDVRQPVEELSFSVIQRVLCSTVRAVLCMHLVLVHHQRQLVFALVPVAEVVEPREIVTKLD